MKWIRYFILSAGVILLVAALTRFLVAFSSAQVLGLVEPMMGIPLRYAVLLVGALELALAYLCLLGKRIHLQTGLLALMLVNYFVYRVAVMTTGGHQQGAAIGSLTDPLRFAGGIAGNIAGFAPFYLLLGSCAGSISMWLGGRAESQRQKGAKSIKMSCPACGVHIRFESARAGQQIDCPQCRKSITLRSSESLKMSCYFCHGHIEFPSHAIGEKLKCPHCSRDISLRESSERISAIPQPEA